ncbi:MAG: pilus assembly protein [Sphingobium sp.]|nr:pilus assembly protein [Sphingobium sp.]
MIRTVRLLRCARGASTIEFALLAPVFLVFLFGLIEAGRLMWVTQSINEVAYSSARCMSTSSSCATTTAIQSYAVSRAATYQLTITAANVVTASNITCDGNAGSNKVTVTYAVRSAVRTMLPFIPASIVGYACFPKLS